MRIWAGAWLPRHLSLPVCSWGHSCPGGSLPTCLLLPQEPREEPRLRFLAGGIELKTKHPSDILHPHKRVRTQAQAWPLPHRPTWLSRGRASGQGTEGVLQFLVGRRKAVPGPSSGRRGCRSLRLET